MGCVIISLFFHGFWRQSRDRFFALFASAFLLLGLSWLVYVIGGESNEFNSSVYLVRLLAFLVIIVAVVDKNRSPRPS